jgi:hypothetical protein
VERCIGSTKNIRELHSHTSFFLNGRLQLSVPFGDSQSQTPFRKRRNHRRKLSDTELRRKSIVRKRKILSGTPSPLQISLKWRIRASILCYHFLYSIKSGLIKEMGKIALLVREY